MIGFIIYLIGVILACVIITRIFLEDEDITLNDIPYILFYCICSWASLIFVLIIWIIKDENKVIIKKKK